MKSKDKGTKNSWGRVPFQHGDWTTELNTNFIKKNYTSLFPVREKFSLPESHHLLFGVSHPLQWKAILVSFI